MRAALFALITLTACGSDDSFEPPFAAELYGTWTGSADDGSSRAFTFSASDTTHAELAGRTDVYVIESGPAGSLAEVQTGTFTVEVTLVTGYGTTDALVTMPLSGGGAGSTFGNAILDYEGSTLIISSMSNASGMLELTKE
jgi:hypothetical protein